MPPAVSPSHPVVLLATQGVFGPPGCQTWPLWHWSDLCFWLQPPRKQIFPLKYISWSSLLCIYFSLLVCFLVSTLNPLCHERGVKKRHEWICTLGFPGVSVLSSRTRVWSQLGNIPWRREWQSAPVFLPGKSQGQRSLAGPHPRDHKRAGHDLMAKHHHHLRQVHEVDLESR